MMTVYSSSSSSPSSSRTRTRRSHVSCWTRFLPLFLVVICSGSTTEALVAPAVVHTVAGAIAGSTGAIAAYPIDFVKSQLQTDHGRAKYSTGMEAAKDIIQQGGPLGLYRGCAVNVIGIAPEKTIKLSANDMVRMAVRAHFGYLPVAGEVVAGAFAGMTQVVVTNPLEVVKVKMQTSDMTIQDVLKQIKSVADLYQGAGACVARDVVFSAVLFPVYSHAKVALQAVLVAALAAAAGTHGGDVSAVAVDGGTALQFWANLLAGSVAAAPAAFISTPPDVIKTRLQQARKQKSSNDSDNDEQQQQECKSFFEVGSDIYHQEGPQVLFSGAFERVVRSVPQFGVTLAVFDVVTTFAIHHGWMLPEM